MAVFVEVARSGGFRAAARNLNLGPGSVSEAVQRFEDRLGIRLFERTTRKIALTAAGEKLFNRSLPAIAELESAVSDLDIGHGEISGTLKLSAPRSAGSLFMDDLVMLYMEIYPSVKVDLAYEDQKIDLVSSGVDAVIRTHSLLEKDTHAVPVGPGLEMSVVASKAYLDKNGIPKTPSDLIKHDGICFAFPGTSQLAPWNFEGHEGTYSVMPNRRISVNDMEAMIRYTQAGLGLTYIYSNTVKTSVKNKLLVIVLKGLTSPLSRYTINYLSKRNMQPRLRAFIDLAKDGSLLKQK